MAVGVCSCMGVDKLTEAHTVYHLHCPSMAFHCRCVYPGGGELTYPLLGSVQCVFVYLWGPGPSWCIREGVECSQTCARGQGQGSSYTNIPREIECEGAVRAYGTTWLTLTTKASYTAHTPSVSSLLSVSRIIHFFSSPLCLYLDTRNWFLVLWKTINKTLNK